LTVWTFQNDILIAILKLSLLAFKNVLAFFF